MTPCVHDNVLERIDKVLAEAGTWKGNLLSATIWLADQRDIEEMNAVWHLWVPPGAALARAR